MKTSLLHQAPLRLRHAELAELQQSNPKASLVDQVFLLVAGRIQTRQLSAGTRLPSVRELAEDCDVSRDTAARAYERLVAHGLVEARRGSGYYVRSSTRRMSVTTSRSALVGPASSGITRWRTLVVKPDPALSSRTGMGCFPESWLDEETLNAALRAVARQSTRALAHYSDLKGYLPLRQQLQVKLQELGILIDAECILITNGATQASHLIAQTFLRADRTPVALEQPGPPLLRDRMMSTGMEIHAIPRLGDGPDLDVMRSVFEKYRPKAFFCCSVLQNPTCTQIAPHKAFQILRLAEEFDVTIIEDDTYGDLMPNVVSASLSRLATLDQLKRVIYVGSFSKTLAPGLRCGFLAASPERIDWLSTYRMLDSISCSNLSERVLYKVLSGGNYRRHCEQLRNRLAAARPVVLAELSRSGLTVERVPEAGMFMWASLGEGVDAMETAERMLEQGHLLAPGPVFSGADQFRSYVRINIAEALNSPMLPALAKLLGRRGY